MVKPSGPGAVDEPEARRASLSSCVVKGRKARSKGCWVRRWRLICLEALFLEGGDEVNCLQKALAMDFFDVRILLLKEMNWLGV